MTAIPPPNAEANDLAACQRKTRYSTEKSAMRVAAHRMSRDCPALRAYQCPECGKWHLTKRDAR